ncbi:hypothetical protein [Streptomyces sp. NPDC056549]|uniref:hypothetical protein n=1 Tax=Streptomyces sp. NPDC056549 TaxID=3345864 RepID=UPI00367AAE46
MGSVLVFLQTEANQNIAADVRRADIRRAAYIDLGARTLTYALEITTTANMASDLSVDKEALRKQCNDQLLPALGALHQARTAVQLVASSDGRAALAAMDTPLSNLVSAGDQACTRRYNDPSTFASTTSAARERLLEAKQILLNKVAAEAI